MTGVKYLAEKYYLCNMSQTPFTKKLKAWIEAMRLRTLPVSIAGVVAGGAVAVANHGFKLAPFCICLVFALMAQIVSNFANEYFDYQKGLDKKGREGFRRGVTEGDISPKAMKYATYGLLALASLVGCSLIYYGGWILVPVGIFIAIGALAYSAGPYPLSHHGLGDVAVFLFYGLIPVFFTAYVQIPDLGILPMSLLLGGAVGFMGMNVLIVNNYRDYSDDLAVGKRTTAVIFGRKAISTLYLIDGYIATALMVIATISYANILWQIGTLLYINRHYLLWVKLTNYEGAQLNEVLGQTAKTMMLMSLWLLLLFACN